MPPHEINHGSAVPVWRQLAAILRDRITAGQYPPGSRMPSETTCEQEFGISRGTVRKGIALLRGEGLVVTVPGRGTYVVSAEELRAYREDPGSRT